MKCPYCGNEHEDDREYCPETGDRIEHCNLGEFLYLIRKAEGGYKILDKDGRPVSPLETIIEVDYRLAAYDQSKMPPYILGFNTADENLYFISPKQILCLADWKNGKVRPLGSSRFPTSCPWYLHEYHHEKEVVLEDDFKSFYIIDKYDYKTYYWVENGNCLSAPKIQALPFINSYESGLETISSSSGEQVIIPGFKACVYLGNENGKHIFWAARRYSSGQYRFKESFIVDIDGNILRQYEYHMALPLAGKYILNTYDGRLKSISKLNGDDLILTVSNFVAIDELLYYAEIEPNVFRFGRKDSSWFWYWLTKENLFCTWYNKDFYIIPVNNGDRCLYRRTDNCLIGTIPCWDDNISGLEFTDNVYYAEFAKNQKRCFFNSSGESIYNLEDNEFPLCASDDPDIFCGAAENRIIVNVDNRYFKILDYSGKEIARVDFTGTADRYQSGRFYYFNETELGYYDYDGVKHLVQYETRKWIKDIKVISSDRLFVKHNNKEVIIDSEGKILIEAISICLEPSGRYFQAFDENYRSYFYDGSCQMLSPLDPGDRVLIME